MWCAREYKVEILTTLCKKALQNFITTEIVCQMMEFAQIYDDPEIVNICLKTAQDDMPFFLYSKVFLKMCSTCVYKILQHEKLFAQEEMIFERVLKWSTEECARKDLPVTAENQRKVLGNILLEIRFPIMGHQYLEDVICRSNLLYDREKLDILRQQLKSQNKKPGMYKVRQRIWQPMDVMTNHWVSTIRNNYVQDRCIYSMKVKISSNIVLLGLYLNIEDHTSFQNSLGVVITSISPMESLGDRSMDNTFTKLFREVKENFVKLYPRFFNSA
jgi:hypothetical protein